MSEKSNIWYVKFPTFRYNEDVKALAREKGLRVRDDRFDDGNGADGPKLTLKPEYAKSESGAEKSKPTKSESGSANG